MGVIACFPRLPVSFHMHHFPDLIRCIASPRRLFCLYISCRGFLHASLTIRKSLRRALKKVLATLYLAIFVSAGSLPLPIQWRFARADSVCIICIWLIAFVCYAEQLLQTLNSVTDPPEMHQHQQQSASSVVTFQNEKRTSSTSFKDAAKYSQDSQPPNF